MERIALGVDLGGTKIEAVVVRREDDGDLVELARERIPTERDHGYEAIVTRTAALVRSVASTAGVAVEAIPIGVGMPGNVTRRGALVKNSNTVVLNGRPFRDDLARAVGRGITFDNDANCFALAEAKLGAARAFGDGVVFGVIMGTGVGAGLIVRGRIWPGIQGIAGEWGHHAVWAGAPDARQCYCGQRGCLERYASGRAVEDDYFARTGEARALADIARRRGEDEHARACIETLVDTFGRAVANVIDILDPSVIVLGGGASNLDLLYDEGRARVAAYVFNDELETPIVRHAVGDSAGVLGAALLALAIEKRVG